MTGLYSLPSRLVRKRAPSQKPRQHPEQDLQIRVAVWLHKHIDIPWTAIGHGAYLPKKKNKNGEWYSPEGKKLKDMGVNSGWPDVHFIHERRPCYIELKSEKGVLSDMQKAAHVAIAAAGGIVTTCRSLDEVIGFLDMLGVPMKGYHPAKVAALLGHGKPLPITPAGS